MNHQRHKRKESLSVLLISNTGRENRQFNIPLPVLRLLPVLLLILLAVTGWLAYEFSVNQKVQSALHTQLTAQEELVQQLTQEKEQLSTDKQTLSDENASLRQQIEEAKAAEEEAAEEEETIDPSEDPAFPGRYPSLFLYGRTALPGHQRLFRRHGHRCRRRYGYSLCFR